MVRILFLNLFVASAKIAYGYASGSVDHVFLDLHVWLDGATPLTEAHAVSHDVKDRLMGRYPQIADAIIHIEPPPRENIG